jgi:molybdate transport system substrate-binding protein
VAQGVKMLPAFGPTNQQLARIREGATADVAILTDAGIEELTAAGILRPGSRVDLARSYVGFAIKPGAPRPDISSREAVIRMLLAAKSLCYSGAGASGVFFAGLIQRLGIADEVNAKATVIPSGFTAAVLARGEVELAVQQISELMAVPGVEILGKLPPEIGTTAVFSGAVFTAARQPEVGAALLRHLAAAGTPELLREKGLEPA